MRSSTLMMLLLSTTTVACAGGAVQARPAAEAPTDPSRWSGDPRLYHMLSGYPITDVQRDSLVVYAGQAGTLMNELLAEAAEDGNAPATVRANALYMLAQNKSGAHLGVFRSRLDDDDARVRAIAVASMREFDERYPMETLQIARMALEDAAVEVQAQALPIIGQRDVPLLREFIARTTHAELQRIARELVAVAEERGAPLDGDSTSGTLHRVTPHGFTVTFTPNQRWPEWDAAAGTVRVEGGAITPFTIEGVEAVGSVLPVFFSSDGAHAVFERDRTIVVRTLATGAERVVGPGIAPRIRPFTNEFVYLREAEDGRRDLRERTMIRYHVLRASFTDPALTEDFGTMGVFTTMSVHGNYSPARWMRVEDRSGNYYLNGTDVEPFALPDPFVTGEAIR